MSRKRIGIMISGRGSNMVALIEACRDGRLDAEAALVLSDTPDAAGLAKARALGVTARALVPEKYRTKLDGDDARAYALAFREAGVDLVCLAGFMRVVKAPLLEAFPGRILNIHPSLLPSFPGLEVQRQALEYGVKFSGCTVHFVDESLDGGAIVAQRVVPILDNDTPETLAERILSEEHQLYPEAAGIVLSGKYRVDGRRVIRT
ncbi:MAG: phosphoribosylglycinamide formyltransferase [bacterium]|nr:phosphoribosylglycinamide formyltransferase [bacterium]